MDRKAADPRFPPREECTVPGLLETRAADHPDRVFARFDDTGEQWTFAQAWTGARAAAGRLQAHGVGRDDRVAVWLPNGADILRAWFGANLLGAAFVPLNLAYRGRILQHVLDIAQARVLVVHPALVERLDGINLGALEVLVADADALAGDPAAFVAPDPPVAPWDTQSVIFTSGTTGPSKGVLCSHLHQYETVQAVAENFRAEDRSLVALPLYHAGATQDAYAALVIRGSFVVVTRFSTEQFWEVVRREGVTVTTLLGAMARFLLSQPPAADDREHPLRTVFLVPLTEDAPALHERFGVDIYTVFNMTEVSAPLVSKKNDTAFGSCGRPRPGVEVRLVDAYDREVPRGQVGELMVRTDTPWAMSHGYLGMPAETARAWRNGWFHTGDAFRANPDGSYVFVDRLKDAIRRRGENISSFEVEAEVAAHPAVQEAAAVAVRSADTEDELLIAIVPVAGATLEPAELVAWLLPRLPHFMVPRFVRVIPDLPRTPTHKVEKYRIRAEGVTADTWDRERAGITVAATRLGS